MNDRLIEEGDEVEIYFDAEHSHWVEGTVLHVPSDTGDAWHLKLKNGQLAYIQTYTIAYRKVSSP